MVFGTKPKLGHLRIPGCKAYTLDNNATKPRTQKLHPRAHIGYLVGYCASTIFRIWIPHLNKIIRSRDVTFDESSFFNPDHPFPDQNLRQLIELNLDKLDLPEQTILATQNYNLSQNYRPRATSKQNNLEVEIALEKNPQSHQMEKPPSPQPMAPIMRLQPPAAPPPKQQTSSQTQLMPTPSPEPPEVGYIRPIPEEDVVMNEYHFKQPPTTPFQINNFYDNNTSPSNDIAMTEPPITNPIANVANPESPMSIEAPVSPQDINMNLPPAQPIHQEAMINPPLDIRTRAALVDSPQQPASHNDSIT